MKAWLAVASEPHIYKRSFKVSMIVGTILVLINQSELIFSGQLSWALMLKIGLTYCVPYSVSTHASVEATMTQRKEK